MGTLGIAALSIVFPIQMIMGAVAATFGAGGASMISRRLGADDVEKANKVFGHVVWLILAFSALLMIIAPLFLKPVLKDFGATDHIYPYAGDYLYIILMGSITLSFSIGANNVVRAEGNAKILMYFVMIGTLVNIILNPIFIFSLNMGMRGAALATIVGQGTAAFLFLRYFLSGKSTLSLKGWVGNRSLV